MSRHGVFKGFVILSIFLAGALSGAAVVRVLSDESGPSGDGVRAEAPGGDQEDGAGDELSFDDGRGAPYAFAQYLEEELDLTPEQRVEILEILERRAEEARRMFAESRERFRNHLEGTVEEVQAALPEDQAEEFHQLMESMERRFRREESRRDTSDASP